MPDLDTVRTWEGRPLVDRDGGRIGPIQAIYSAAEERQLWRHYGLDYDPGDAGRDRDPGGRDPSGTVSDAARTRSEEQLRVGTAQRERGRVRLCRYVTTEPVQQTVPVRREGVRVEREPITDANWDAATSGPELSEAEHEVTLRAQTPVVDKRVVPKERVRLDTATVTDEERVTEELRKEHIDLDDDRTEAGRHQRHRRR